MNRHHFYLGREEYKGGREGNEFTLHCKDMPLTLSKKYFPRCLLHLLCLLGMA